MSVINFDNFDNVVKEAKELAIKKNKLYGVDNLLIFDGFGILVRINDKVSRLNNLINPFNHKIDIKHEKLNDILLDLINYSIYLYLFKNSLLF